MVKMSFETPTLRSLLLRAAGSARHNTELLVLLALLCGLVSAWIFAPAQAILLAVQELLRPGGEDNLQAAFDLLSSGLATLILGYLGVLLVTALAVVPWARRVAPAVLAPLGGGAMVYVRRAGRMFVHLATAAGLTILAFLAVFTLSTLVGAVVPALNGVLFVAATVVAIWMLLAISATAHLAVGAEARDRRETLSSAWLRARIFLQPMVGSYACLLLLFGFFNILLTVAVLSFVPERLAPYLGDVINFAIFYTITALHVAAVYGVPDFRDVMGPKP